MKKATQNRIGQQVKLPDSLLPSSVIVSFGKHANTFILLPDPQIVGQADEDLLLSISREKVTGTSCYTE